jgi:hypothetical protein
VNRKERRAEALRARKVDSLGALARTVRSMQLGSERSGDGVPPSPCGHCKKELDGASAASGAKAKPGDLSVCAYCAGINVFGVDLALLPLTDEQVEIHPQAAALREHQALIRAAHLQPKGARRQGEPS